MGIVENGMKKNWVNTESDRAAVKAGYRMNETRGRKVCRFFRDVLKHTKGKWAGDPFKLLAWERNDFLMPLFGWEHKRTKQRRYNIGYVQVAKKNGKSTLCAGLSTYLLVDNEKGAEIYNVAGSRDQAAIVFNEARNMVRSSPMLDEVLRVTDSRKRIDYMQQLSFLRVMSSEAYTADGVNMYFLIFDELHTQKKRELWDALRYSGEARDESMLLSITTAGWDQSSICYEQYRYAKGIIDGTIEDIHFFPLIYEAGPKDDPFAPATWRKANPSLGTTISLKKMEQSANEARQSPRKLNSFRRYRLNQWTEQENRWLSPETWAKCTDLKKGNNPRKWRENQDSELYGKSCYAGLDLGSTSDLTACTLFFPDNGVLLPWFWVPEAALNNPESPNRNQYRTWHDQGYLTVTPGNVTDYDHVRADMNAIGEQHHILELAVDRLFQGAQLCTQLMDDGFEVIAFGQGFYSMAAPCKEFEERVLSGRFEHGRNPILNWMAANVAVRTDPAGNMKPTKPDRNSPYKIDGIVAAIMALGRSMLQEGEKNECNVTVIE